jgi:uncharacterized protein (TIGR03663 family)
MNRPLQKEAHRVLIVAAIVAVAVGAFAFHVPRLDQRPMHTDEAVHAVKVGILLETGVYTYDPLEYHGPTIYYAALPFIWASGARTLAQTSEWQFRIVPVVFGVGLILLLLLVIDGLGPWEAVCAAILTAVSPAMVFYSRYYIQEMPFVFFTFCAIAAGWRYGHSKRVGWALLCGLGLGLMLATKETAVIAYGAMAAALVLTALWARWRDGEAAPIRENFRPWHVAAAVVVGLVACVTVVSGFFTTPRGAVDIFLTFLNYLHRAGGVGIHDHPWDYYFRILLGLDAGQGPRWNEKLIVVMAVVGVLVALSSKRVSKCEDASLKSPPLKGDLGGCSDAALTEGGAPAHPPESPFKGGLPLSQGRDLNLVRFIAIYTLLLSAVYAAIPYKTPWCMLGFLHGLILLSGVGFIGLVRFVRHNGLRLLFVLAMAFATFRLADLAYQASFVFYADTRNPYVYGHTSTDMLRLVQRIEDIARLAPDGRNTLIKVFMPDSWPLPWYLRAYTRVGYWPAVIDDADAPIVIASQELQPEVERRLRDTYQSEYYGQRPEVLMTAFIRKDLWDAFIKTRTVKESQDGR